jgi:hypothetical protein
MPGPSLLLLPFSALETTARNLLLSFQSSAISSFLQARRFDLSQQAVG